MKKLKSRSKNLMELRKRAKIPAEIMDKDFLRMTAGEAREHLRELQAYHVDLEKENEKLRRAGRALKIFCECNREMMRAGNEGQLLNNICRIIVEKGGYVLAWVGLAEMNKQKSIRPIAHYGLEDVYLKAVRVTWDDAEHGRGPAGAAIRAGRPYVNRDTITNSEYKPRRMEAERRGYASSASLPLVENDRSFGSLNIYAKEPDAFDEQEISVLQDLARNISFGIKVLQERSKQKRTEKKLKRSQERYREPHENSPNIYASVDAETGKILLCDQTLLSLEALLNLGQIMESTPQEIADFAMEEAVRLTESKFGLLGFLSADENLVTVFSWSRAAMKECAVSDKPIHYPVADAGLWGEAVRRREPIIINDLAAPHPAKKGYPKGHLSIHRFLGVPIFENKQIVAVVAVGNKEKDYDKSDVRQLTLLMNGVWEQVQRRKAEEQINKLSRALEQSQASIVITDTYGTIEYVNPKFTKVSGYSFEEAVGENPRILKSGETLPEEYKKLWETIASGGEWRGNFHNRKKTGELYWESASISPVRNKEGKITHFVGIKEDITERKMADEKIRLLSKVFSEANDPILILDLGGKIIDLNPEVEQSSGWSREELAGKPLNFLVPPERHEQAEDLLARCRKGEEIRNIEGLRVTKTGETRNVLLALSLIKDDKGKSIAIANITKDITLYKKMEEELVRAEKLESLGVLAGGVAHDFKNILQGMLSSIFLLKGDASRNKKISNRLDIMERMCLHAKDLSGQLLTFAAGGAPVKECSLNADFIKECVDFALRGTNVRCDYSMAGDIWPCEIDAGQIVHVLNNIVINACQSMPKGGEIQIGLKNIFQGGECPFLLKGVKYVEISIRDQGKGIQAKELPKIFDPFYSTKEGGTGLGLATSYSIIKKHGGFLTAESEPNKGSVFRIYLPACEKMPPLKEKKEIPVSTGKRKILLMDDEEDILRPVSRLLTLRGYEVATAKDGNIGMELYKAAKDSGKPFCVVIMDLTVRGGMGGEEMIHELKKTDPRAKAIVSSAYSNSSIMADYKKYGFSAALPKPYTPEELVKVLEKVIGLNPDVAEPQPKEK